MPADRLDALVGLCRRRGFVYPAAEIYSPARAAWDFGPLGVELKENIRRAWWKACVQGREDVVGLDCAVIAAPAVWQSSGHVEAFADAVLRCRSCHRRCTGAELGVGLGAPTLQCPACGARNSFSSPTRVPALLPTSLSTPGGELEPHYLRPESAQGAFVNFVNVMSTSRKRPPFGIAQVGRSFRNEPVRNTFLLHAAEFENLELEFFVRPGTEAAWHDYWLGERWRWYLDLGLAEGDLVRRERPAHSRAHWALRTVDIRYRFAFPGRQWAALEGVSNRGDGDLVAHSKHSGADLSYFEQESGERWAPQVIESSAGLGGCVLAFLAGAYAHDSAPSASGSPAPRTLLRLDPRLAPVKVAVLPLSRNAELSPRARELAADLRRNWNVEFDDAGAIGRRYRRQDEIGTPYCVTVDFQTLADAAVTVRERDSMAQQRVSLDKVAGYLAQRLVGC
ncbi:MAG: glycine--tRNA ligase [Sporichthyaceae bacterium]